jgi:GNAT superfamily N-acetyltransferase
MPFDGTIREATVADRDFVISEVPRLAAFGPPAWRPPETIAAGERRVLESFFDGETTGCGLYVAEDPTGRLLGFVFIETETDYYTRVPQAHVGILVVAKAGEGRGVAGALLRESEVWARARRMSMITLNVFVNNTHAREVYEHMEYRPDHLHYVKVLGDA